MLSGFCQFCIICAHDYALVAFCTTLQSLASPLPWQAWRLGNAGKKKVPKYTPLFSSITHRLLTTASLGIHTQELQWLVCKGSTPSWRSSTTPLVSALPSWKILVHGTECFLPLIPSTNLGDCHMDDLFHTLAFSHLLPLHSGSSHAFLWPHLNLGFRRDGSTSETLKSETSLFAQSLTFQKLSKGGAQTLWMRISWDVC